jgi:hypothetical protein
MIKTCKTHGETEFVLEKRGYYRCKQCRIDRVQARREKIKKLAVEYKGGKCEICGYNKCINALEFHHNDSSKKEFGIAANGHCRSWENVKIEIDKCTLLCSNCHKESHIGT